jgi:hypothetical protein
MKLFKKKTAIKTDMKCYCYETENKLIFCVENASKEFKKNLEAAWFKKDGEKFIKVYDGGMTEADKKLLKNNFARLGKAMFDDAADWETVLSFFADRCAENEIEWYIIGSASEALLGVDIKPHDIDIAVHTKDFFKVKNLFAEYVVEPFVDNKGAWSVRYFGRLCIGRGYLDIAADEKLNAENRRYEKTLWNNRALLIEPLNIRYQTEIQRKRKDRIKAIEAYMEKRS